MKTLFILLLFHPCFATQVLKNASNHLIFPTDLGKGAWGINLRADEIIEHEKFKIFAPNKWAVDFIGETPEYQTRLLIGLTPSKSEKNYVQVHLNKPKSAKQFLERYENFKKIKDPKNKAYDKTINGAVWHFTEIAEDNAISIHTSKGSDFFLVIAGYSQKTKSTVERILSSITIK